MKISDVEYQADKKKLTLYYSAEGRVDFRELVKIEMWIFLKSWPLLFIWKSQILPTFLKRWEFL